MECCDKLTLSCLNKVKCHLCGNLAKNPYSLAAHLRSKHQVESVGYKSYPCPTCGAKFKCQFNLDQHVKKHADPSDDTSKHVCTYCGLKTSSEYNLSSHISRRHKEGSPHLCNFCGKTFKVIF